MAKIQTLKGFRDITPEEALKRGRVLALIKSVFKSYGFVPLETPTLEYAELLEGKYGEEEKLIYKFKDRGGRVVALRYDLTVPLARFVAENRNKLVFPFKRYQIQSAFRAEKPQALRWREFTQVDFDIVGVDSALADAETVAVVTSVLQILGVKDFKIIINDRTLFEGLAKKAITILDKWDKIGREGVKRELKKIGLDAEKILKESRAKKPTPRLTEIFKLLPAFGIDERLWGFDPLLARGLDYYTGMVLEARIAKGSASIGGGGRYDNLIGIFCGEQIPAVGLSFGLDRLMEVVPEETLKDIPFCPQVLVTIFSEDLTEQAIKTLTAIQSQGIDAEIYLDPTAKLDKQLRYADKKGIPYAVIIGSEEAKEKKVTIKDLRRRRQETIPLAALTAVLKQE